MGSTNLVVPVVLWGPFAPTHCVSSVFLSRDQRTLATGCYDGQICLWQLDPETIQMTPRCLLVGHTAPVLCLSRASIIQDNNFLVSSSETGEMCTWDLIDGKCRESTKLSQIRCLNAITMSCCSQNQRTVLIVCAKYWQIYDAGDFTVLCSVISPSGERWLGES
uniref:Uncharacterized protein n=1 Tax=Phlebotomus papatasi TaxID=29031 RepID=A0A1B0D0M5_PHLPP